MNFLKKLKNTLTAISPLVCIVLILQLVLVWTHSESMGWSELGGFFIACALVILGQVIFLIGIDNGFNTMGEMTGAATVKFKKTVIVLFVAFVFGFLITIADPDIFVLSDLVSEIMPATSKMLLILVVAFGVGLYVVLSFIKTIFKIKIKYLLLASYAIVFILAAFSPSDFVPLAFDSGGIILGPIFVPFILALGIGAAAVRGGKNDSEDSFGTVALASIGPVIAILILGLLSPVGGEMTPITYPPVLFGDVLLETLLDVFIGVAPITFAFFTFQFIFIKLPRQALFKILSGVAMVFVGLVLFLSGINFGFSATGFAIGDLVSETSFVWILVPVAVIIGMSTVFTEPAIAVTGEQIENVTSGNVKKRTLKFTMAGGVGLAYMLAVLKILFSISIWWFIIPTFIIALTLMFFTSNLFTSIAFDCGAVASGPITATFTLPLLIGMEAARGGDVGENILLFAFGIVILVSVIPLILVQSLGLIGKLKEKRINMHKAESFRKAVVNDFDFSRLEEAI